MKPETMTSITDRPFFCSWSGGKDSCLALCHAIKQGGRPQSLFTMLTEDGRNSRSHGLPKSLLEQQARQLGLPIVFGSATWGGYETKFQAALRECRQQGIEHGVFGDIDVEPHREWCLRMCQAKGLGVFHPLWQRSRRELLREFIDLGFTAIIVVTQADKLGPEWLGRTIDDAAMRELAQTGIDICGELGEYHTLVTGGPLFKSELTFTRKETVHHDGYWFLKLE
ncbi:MAG: diphthine--ammonia ligase [Deltaproteobacteria bacterium]|nr:diphthine--ammonia ligase [Deltaproteobacteria bacterium]